MKVVLDGTAEPPLGPLSRAVAVGDLVFVSGTVGAEPDGSYSTDVGRQTTRTLQNVAAHLEAGGLGLEHVVSVTIYLTRAEDYKAMNEAYSACFSGVLPARTTVVCAMVHQEHLIEISAIAHKGAMQ
ncbi:RidA family protein [Pseudonocardia sp. H11422]|uniref:RidA family protein n=1 Tax=Pseudonocardia sp. H11422 TaxID=2835866 RepID=UPI001BDC18DD|nr:RidA family protein [Pseudonocardia sp. H11422]